MTVTLISSSIVSSNAAPQIIFADGSACWAIIEEAVSISSSPISGDAVTLIITPFAPFIAVSKSGLEIAIFAAASALSLPLARPTPMCAYPASFMIDVTSAKSRLTRPGNKIRSEILCTPCLNTSSATINAFISVILC